MTHWIDTRHIKGWHAHVYFDAATQGQARELCQALTEALPGIQQGRMHEKAVGPHPDWSCQLAFGHDLIADVLGFLSLNRQGLTVFIHPITGQDLIDHRDRAIWMGAIRPLKLENLPDFGVVYDLLSDSPA
ncbi:MULTISPECIES: DOPA 4,5-dioxygenase family protein [unclassified Oceanobacter]|uniref:DOPA 4,5-dioxygenase family protein n=1 Tax=unclassified Oceanobacter TaxID=2620260 RepID=UPI00270BF47B|nr:MULTISPECIES: DOPA 4,5-dioxygenase family protein [unclassified Oceanobacter]MDO6683253.1 DOPA 4,5-dioxygenase family protein [Oceanobacter sp. 5_MG-2023]MDP2504182.1 DOPA 4,5-dioxygenase family protein [Oceanobacter sp. 3_MG-2023]MDP2546620.1 DOPA 4,5-dioxygenase family protein [Oceanobacter sp. 4_MG-2023]